MSRRDRIEARRDWRVSLLLGVAIVGVGCGDPDPPRAPPRTPEAPEGMIAVPSGHYLDHRGDRHDVATFFLDRSPVTVGAFRPWASAREPTLAAREGGGVFTVDGAFTITPGADYETPRGEGTLAEDDHPVTQVTAAEAEAYCASRDARLPTSDEWEHAARNGRGDRGPYPWGETLEDEAGRPRANVWQGSFPAFNTMTDGHLFASPVGSFPATPLGFVDLIGNVWQWTSTPWPAGLNESSPALPYAAPADARVIRGGSFLCDERVCHGYRIDGAQPADPGSPLMHVGFRCASSP